ncbi:MAG: 2-hydroxychromene-2-carboxylate isomerase [Myxococcota bacterium]
MSETIEFYYDFVSPPTYIGFCRLPELQEKFGVTVEYKPMLLGGVHKAVEHKAAVTQTPSKIRWMFKDLSRTAKRHGIPLTMNKHFPMSTVGLMRGALVAKERGEIETFNRAFFGAIWAEGKNVTDPEVMMGILTEAGLDPSVYATRTQEPAIKELLKAETATAVERGVFGSPSYFVRDELVFGQDRHHVVEEILGE